jgi:pimeloyl-ACP methyl ester carboxylesterase
MSSLTAPMSNLTAPNLSVSAANGVEYAYRRFGRTGGTPILFLHHLRANLDNWDPALVDDIATEHDVILLDNAGVGGSTGETPRSIAAMATDAIAFIEALELTSIDLFGFSLGGMVAQELVLRRPYLVRRLVLAGTAPEGGREIHTFTNDVADPLLRDVLAADDGLYLFFSPSEESQRKGGEFLTRIFTRSEGRDADTSLATRDAQIEALSAWGIPDTTRLNRLAGITQPTLVANGDHDRIFPTPNSYLLAGHIPNARLAIYPDAGHGFLFQYAHEFAAETIRFLSDTQT